MEDVRKTPRHSFLGCSEKTDSDTRDCRSRARVKICRKTPYSGLRLPGRTRLARKSSVSPRFRAGCVHCRCGQILADLLYLLCSAVMPFGLDYISCCKSRIRNGGGSNPRCLSACTFAIVLITELPVKANSTFQKTIENAHATAFGNLRVNARNAQRNGCDGNPLG